MRLLINLLGIFAKWIGYFVYILMIIIYTNLVYGREKKVANPDWEVDYARKKHGKF